MNKLLVFIASALLAGPAIAQDDALDSFPGFVDFGPLDEIYGEPVVQVALAEPLLGFLSAVSAQENPETAEVFGKLKGIRVQIYDVGTEPDAAINTMSDVSERLKADQWAPIVRVREQDERVDIFMKMSEENIEGLTVMVAGDDEQAVFVNIIGNIHPSDLQQVMDTVDVSVGDIEIN